MKTDSVAPNGPAGAGAGKVSPSPPLKFDGWNDPLVSSPLIVEFGSIAAAASSKVNVTGQFVQAVAPVPPASDISKVLAPVGPTTSMSRSSGRPEGGAPMVKPVSVTVILDIVPVSPETAIVDG